MKVFFRHIDYTPERSFAWYSKKFNHFDAPIHFHPEFELAYIMTTKGKLFIGNNISDYGQHELLLIGSNVPHCWKSEISTPQKKAHSIVLHFKEDFLGEDFFLKPELIKIKKLLEKSKHGLLIKGRAKKEVVLLLHQIDKEKDGLEQLLALLRILKIISKSKECVLLNKQLMNKTVTHYDCERINTVYNYIMKHYQNEIRLDAVAKEIAMSPESFCRYFKKMTRKTLIETVTEYRINNACNLLKNTDKSIPAISLGSGFKNLPHFNNCFRKQLTTTPLKYRKDFFKQQELGNETQMITYKLN